MNYVNTSRPPDILAAIEIGLTYSGIAFKLLHEPLFNIHFIEWPNDFIGKKCVKTISALLLKETNFGLTVDKFGFEAAEKFASIQEEQEDESEYIFVENLRRASKYDVVLYLHTFVVK